VQAVGKLPDTYLHVRHAAASFAIEVRRAEMKKAREELGKPPKGTA